jgi:predicted deacylase
MANGIPAITPEFMNSYRQTFNKGEEISIQVAVRGALNVLKHMKMISGQIEEQTGIQVLHGNYVAAGQAKANRGGLVHRLAKVGVKLSKGTPIAEIYNLYGDVAETIEMPVDGWIWGWSLKEGATSQMGSPICYAFAEV